jgi:hypothetical protein
VCHPADKTGTAEIIAAIDARVTRVNSSDECGSKGENITINSGDGVRRHVGHDKGRFT